MPFKRGKSANPGGRPKGSRGKKTVERQELLDKLEAHAPEIIETLVRCALDADPVALRIVCGYLLPRERPVKLTLPPVSDATSARAALEHIIAAAGRGELSPSEAEGLSRVVLAAARVELPVGELVNGVPVEGGFVTWRTKLLCQPGPPENERPDILPAETE
jgi:hypothetical protein